MSRVVWPRSTRSSCRARQRAEAAESYEKLAYNQRTRAFFEALRRGLVNSEELESAARSLQVWLDADVRRYAGEWRSGGS